MELEYEDFEKDELNEDKAGKTGTKEKRDEKPGDKKAPNPFDQIFSTMSFSSGSLSKDATDYFQEILDALDYTRLGFKVDVRLLSVGDTTVVVYYSDKYAVSLIMGETFTTITDSSPAMLIPELKKKVKKEIPQVSICLNEMVVFPSEYNRKRQMTDWIEKLFMSRLKFSQKFTLSNMKDKVFNVELSAAAGESYRKICPLTPARHDLTLRISLTDKKPKKSPGLFGEENKKKEEGKVLAYITGYAETIKNPRAERNSGYVSRDRKEDNPYLVVFRATEILPLIPDINSLAWALPIIVDQYGKNKKYLAQFANFASGYNAGHLCGKNDAGELIKITSQEEFEAFHNSWLTNASIALDVSFGRPCIPGLTKLVTGSHSKIIEALNEFVGDRMSIKNSLGAAKFTEYGGLVKNDGEYVDSRRIDYISFAEKYKANLESIAFLKRKDRDPIRRFKQISSTLADITPAYIHKTFVIDPGFAKRLMTIVKEKHLSFRTTNNRDFDEGMDMTDFLDQAAGLSGIEGIGGGFGGSDGIIDEFFDDSDDIDFF